MSLYKNHSFIYCPCHNMCLNFLYRLSLPLHVLKNKDTGRTDIWSTSIVDRYLARPDGVIFDDMSLADFCAQYRIKASSNKPNDPNTDDDNDNSNTLQTSYNLKHNLGSITLRYVSFLCHIMLHLKQHFQISLHC